MDMSEAKKKDQLPACPVETTLTLIGDKWKVLILRDLMPGTKRFGELRKSVGDVSQKVLAAQLRDMGFTGDIEADGGINGDNAPQLAQVGIDTLVMGTAFFRAEEPEALVRRVHSL